MHMQICAHTHTCVCGGCDGSGGDGGGGGGGSGGHYDMSLAAGHDYASPRPNDGSAARGGDVDAMYDVPSEIGRDGKPIVCGDRYAVALVVIS